MVRWTWVCGSLKDSNFISFGYIPRSGIAELYGSSIFNFLKNLHTIYHSGCTNVYQHQQCTGVPFPPHLHQDLSLIFLITVILKSVKCYLLALTCISLIIKDVQHLFMYLLAICMSSSEKYLFRFFVHFLIGFFCCCLISLYIFNINPLSDFHLQIVFLPL